MSSVRSLLTAFSSLLRTSASPVIKLPGSSGVAARWARSFSLNVDGMSTQHQDEDEGVVIRARGLPWSATEESILEFFGSEVNILGGKNGVHLTMSREGRPSGEAYIELASEDDLVAAEKKHNCSMGSRYIEVFRSKASEMNWVVKRSGLNSAAVLDDGCVRLRGLPFGCSKEEIANFFSGLEVVPNGITLPMDNSGRPSGEAYVQFVSKEVAEKALLKNKERIGHRYIEIFRSSLGEVRQAQGPNNGKVKPLMMGRPTPYDRGDRWGGGGGRFGGGGRGNRRGGGFHGEYDDYYDNGGPGVWAHGGPGGGMGGPGGMGRRGGMKGGGDMVAGSKPWQSVTGHTVHMRGLPFRSPESDVIDFFRPLNPVQVHMLFDDMGRPSGQANVDFSSHEEAVKAMQKDKSSMGHRYIELFLNSTPAGNYEGGAGGPGGGYGGGGYGAGGGANSDGFAAGGGGYGGGPGGGGYGGGGGFSGRGGPMSQQGWGGNEGGYGGAVWRTGGMTGGYNGSSQMGGNNYNSFM